MSEGKTKRPSNLPAQTRKRSQEQGQGDPFLNRT